MMSKMPVDEAPAGPAMDAAVAEALGLQVKWWQLPDNTQEPVYFAGTYAVRHDGWAEHEDWRRVLPYSTDIAAAWELWRHLAQRGTWSFEFSNDGDGWCEAIFYKDERLARGEGDGGKDEAATICRAFLKANGVQYIRVPE